MGLQQFERRLERLVEGAFAKAFRGQLQPIELGRRLTREMDLRRAVGIHGFIVPNQFNVFLAPEDFERFEEFGDSLERELITVAARQVAFDRQESSIDIICAGAPVFGPDQQVVAALSVTSPVGRARLDQIAPHVAAAARGVTKALADSSAGRARQH